MIQFPLLSELSDLRFTVRICNSKSSSRAVIHAHGERKAFMTLKNSKGTITTGTWTAAVGSPSAGERRGSAPNTARRGANGEPGSGVGVGRQKITGREAKSTEGILAKPTEHRSCSRPGDRTPRGGCKVRNRIPRGTKD